MRIFPKNDESGECWLFQVVSCYFTSTSLFDSSRYRTPILHTYTLCILRAYCTSTQYSCYGKILWLVPVKPGSTVTPLLFFLSSVLALFCHHISSSSCPLSWHYLHISTLFFCLIPASPLFFLRSLRIICHPADKQLSPASLHLLTAGLHALSSRIWEAFFSPLPGSS